MSVFRTIESPCPICTVPSKFDLVYSVNADRRADLRQEIIDRRFQQQNCPACGATFRVEPEFTYLHTQGGVWIAACPASKLAQWPAVEQRSRQAFEKSFGPAAGDAAVAIGAGMVARVTFGWEALREKLIARDYGVNDHTLELAKIAVIRDQEDENVAGDLELRLIGIDAEAQMIFAWFQTGNEQLQEIVSVPRTLLDEIEAAPDDWQELRDELSTGLFVDMQRLLLVAPTETPSSE